MPPKRPRPAAADSSAAAVAQALQSVEAALLQACNETVPACAVGDFLTSVDALVRKLRLQAEPGSPWGRLPADVLEKILLLLPARDVCRAAAVGRAWRQAAARDSLWRRHYASDWGGVHERLAWRGSWRDLYAERWQVQRNWLAGRARRSRVGVLPSDVLAAAGPVAVRALQSAGPLLAFARGQAVELWEWQAERQLAAVPEAHAGDVVALQFDSDLLISCGFSDVALWSMDEASLLAPLARVAFGSPPLCLGRGPRTMDDGRLRYSPTMAIVGLDDGHVGIFDPSRPDDESRRARVRLATDAIRCVQWTETLLMVGTYDGSVRGFAIRPGEPFDSMLQHRFSVAIGDAVLSLMFSGPMCVAANGKGEIYVVELSLDASAVLKRTQLVGTACDPVWGLQFWGTQQGLDFLAPAATQKDTNAFPGTLVATDGARGARVYSHLGTVDIATKSSRRPRSLQFTTDHLFVGTDCVEIFDFSASTA